jgi:DNA-directed RNA polymerase sigma subunit (sigma70/sigma32)
MENRKEQKQRSVDLSRTDIINLIDEWILSARNRRILKRRLIDGVCFEPLAEEFNLSVRQVKNIVYKSQELLFKHIT